MRIRMITTKLNKFNRYPKAGQWTNGKRVASEHHTQSDPKELHQNTMRDSSLGFLDLLDACLFSERKKEKIIRKVPEW